MKIPSLSERPDTEEEEQAFLASPSRSKKRTLADRQAALRPWAIGIGLTVLVAVAAVAAYRLAAGIDWWNEPSAAATPTVHPAPMPSASSEPAMSGGYAIGPDGVLVRPAEFAADTYTKPELPEAAKENSEAAHPPRWTSTSTTRSTGGKPAARPSGRCSPSSRRRTVAASQPSASPTSENHSPPSTRTADRSETASCGSTITSSTPSNEARTTRAPTSRSRKASPSTAPPNSTRPWKARTPSSFPWPPSASSRL